jgi:hypothetical protein
MNNGEQPAPLNFTDSVSHNIRWIKQMAEEHDCSTGMAATAALMTMTMMDHHRMAQHLTKLENDLATLTELVCPSNL